MRGAGAQTPAVRFAFTATCALVGAIGWVGLWMPFVVEQLAAVEQLLGHPAPRRWPPPGRTTCATNSTSARRPYAWRGVPGKGAPGEGLCASHSPLDLCASASLRVILSLSASSVPS